MIEAGVITMQISECIEDAVMFDMIEKLKALSNSQIRVSEIKEMIDNHIRKHYYDLACAIKDRGYDASGFPHGKEIPEAIISFAKKI